MKRLWLLLVLILLVLLPALAQAHPLAPASLLLVERAGGNADVTFKRALVQPRGTKLTLALPPGCVRSVSSAAESDGAWLERFTLRCDDGLAGAELGIDGLQLLNGIVRVELANGDVHRALLDASSPRTVVPSESRAATVLRDYVWLGVQHLLTGLDHVLFVLGLLLLVHVRRDVVIAVTSFTAGHSITLAAATLGWVHAPQNLIELVIALTLLVLAAHVHAKRHAPKRVWLMAGGFGLLHGFAFAGALTDAGLPAGDIPLALFSFNVGVELAQLAVVLAFFALRRWVSLKDTLLPAYALGSLAAMWMFERAANLF
jgi:hydrogenase/urease accessory protein HupE